MIATLVLAAVVVTSESAASQLLAIAEAHQRLERFDLSIDVTFGGSAAPPLNATVQKIDSRRHRRIFGDLTILETPDWRLAVDSGDRVIVVGRRVEAQPAAETIDRESPAIQIKTWLERGATVADGGLSRDGQVWLIESREGLEIRARLVVDPQTSLVRRLSYEMKDSGGAPVHVDIRYTWRDAGALRADQFEETQFIVASGDEVRPAEAYASYKILRSDGSR